MQAQDLSPDDDDADLVCRFLARLHSAKLCFVVAAVPPRQGRLVRILA